MRKAGVVVLVGVRWLASSAALLLVVSALTFVLLAISPGNAATAILGGESAAYTPVQYAHVRHLLGIDQPLPVQYWHWLDRLLHGSLGTDLFSGQSVTAILGSRIGVTLSLVLGTVVVSGVVGVTFGIISAWRGRWQARAVDVGSLIGFAIPNFWLALVLVEIFAVRLNAFPVIGYTAPGTSIGGWIRSIVLPVVSLSAGSTAFVAKQTRDAMSDVLAREFVTMLRARGLSTATILIKHALRNAAIPVVTVTGLLFVSLLGGTVLIEQVFALPGLGQLAVTSSGSHDMPVIEGVAFYFTIMVVIVNLLVDISYRMLNPRVRGQ